MSLYHSYNQTNILVLLILLQACVVVVAALAGVTSAAYIPATPEDSDPMNLLSTFKSSQSQLVRGPDGTYSLSFSLPQQERTEQRDENGKVSNMPDFRVDK